MGDQLLQYFAAVHRPKPSPKIDDQATWARIGDGDDSCDEHCGTHHTHQDAIGEIEAWPPAQQRPETHVPVRGRKSVPGAPGLLLDRQLVTCPLAITSVGAAGTRR